MCYGKKIYFFVFYFFKFFFDFFEKCKNGRKNFSFFQVCRMSRKFFSRTRKKYFGNFRNFSLVLESNPGAFWGPSADGGAILTWAPGSFPGSDPAQSDPWTTPTHHPIWGTSRARVRSPRAPPPPVTGATGDDGSTCFGWLFDSFGRPRAGPSQTPLTLALFCAGLLGPARTCEKFQKGSVWKNFGEGARGNFAAPLPARRK